MMLLLLLRGCEQCFFGCGGQQDLRPRRCFFFGVAVGFVKSKTVLFLCSRSISATMDLEGRPLIDDV